MCWCLLITILHNSCYWKPNQRGFTRYSQVHTELTPRAFADIHGIQQGYMQVMMMLTRSVTNSYAVVLLGEGDPVDDFGSQSPQ